MKPNPTWRWLAVWTWSASIVLHVALVRSLWRVAEQPRRAYEVAVAPAPSAVPHMEPLAIKVPVVSEISIDREEADPAIVPPINRGGRDSPALDNGEGGRGGDRAARELAVNMSPRDDAMRRTPDPFSHLSIDQLQRIKSENERRSWENRRSTTHPMELTLLATGEGTVVERRPTSLVMPTRGVSQAPVEARRAARGGDVGSVVVGDPDALVRSRARGEATHDEQKTTIAVGLASRPQGDVPRFAAPVGTARPDVTQAPVAVVAEAPGRPSDVVDSEQRVAATVASLIHASAAARETGEGVGGAEGGGMAAVGGTTGGARARPVGFVDGDIFDLDTTDPRLIPYFRQIHAKLGPLWANAFPRSAIMDLKQGRVILEFTLDESGHAKVSWPPVRPSGIPEFDRNCADAIVRGSPYGPLPKELGVHALRIRAPFSADNPVVR